MNKFKNPIAYLKHIVKDPIQTIAEADERKKEIMPLLYISIALIVVSAVLMTFIDLAFLSIVTLIGLAGAGLSAFLLSIISKAKAKFAALTCDGCNTMISIDNIDDFNKYVSYEIIKENTSSNVTHPGSNNGVVSVITATGESTAVTTVSFVCPNCGKTKTFRYTITPFKCQREQKNVRVADVEVVKINFENTMRSVMEEYESGDRSKIPYSIQSIHSPDYENRTKPQTSRPVYNGVTIVYHREIDEMVEGLFIRNELNGSIKTDK